MEKMRMQQVRFRDVEECLDWIPEEERTVALALREIVLDSLPGAKEKLSYNVPYYRLRSDVCFIWPASVLWGRRKTWEGVRLGFVRGYLMDDALDYLDKGDRKQVFWRDFQTLSDIDPVLLRAYLQMARDLDSQR